MHASRLFQSTLVSVFVVIVAAWWLAVPGLMNFSTFVAIFGILAASALVVKSTLENARPASSFAQSVHDVEAAATVKRLDRN
jgi:hypothetical protein